MALLPKPTVNVAIKLASALVHAEEYMSAHGHPIDKAAFDTLMADTELRDWMAEMRSLGLLPLKRN